MSVCEVVAIPDMEIRHLLKSPVNEVFEVIRARGLEPSDFDWRDTVGSLSSSGVSQLVRKSSGYYFVFDNVNNRFYSKWSPGEQTLTKSEEASGWQSQRNSSARGCPIQSERLPLPIFGVRFGRKPRFSILLLPRT